VILPRRRFLQSSTAGALFVRGGVSPTPSIGLYPLDTGDTGTQNHLALFNSWLGRTANEALLFVAAGSWAAMDAIMSSAETINLSGLVQIHWAIGLTVSGTTLAQVAGGSNDADFTGIATAILALQATGRIFIRLGWEFNGDWEYWASYGVEANYISAFQRVVGLFRAVSSRFYFIWAPNVTQGVPAGTGVATASATGGVGYTNGTAQPVTFTGGTLTTNQGAAAVATCNVALGIPGTITVTFNGSYSVAPTGFTLPGGTGLIPAITTNTGTVIVNPTNSYPGDAYVDCIGMSAYYDITLDSSDPSAAFGFQESSAYGFTWQIGYAQTHGKDFEMSEWGVNSDNKQVYINLMAGWLKTNGYKRHNYWDSNENFNGQLSNGQYPATGAAFIAAFQ
jgi:hypothetical protein